MWQAEGTRPIIPAPTPPDSCPDVLVSLPGHPFHWLPIPFIRFFLLAPVSLLGEELWWPPNPQRLPHTNLGAEQEPVRVRQPAGWKGRDRQMAVRLDG